MSDTARLRVEVAYASPTRVVVQHYEVSAAASVGDLLDIAGADSAFAGIDLARAALGIFGLRVGRDQRLLDGDRLEVYRPLLNDPKTARRLRAGTPRRKGSRGSQ